MVGRLLRRGGGLSRQQKELLERHLVRGQEYVGPLTRDFSRLENAAWEAAVAEGGRTVSLSPWKTETGERLLAEGPEVAVSVVVAAVAGRNTELALALSRRKLRYSADDVALLFALAIQRPQKRPPRLPLSASEDATTAVLLTVASMNRIPGIWGMHDSLRVALAAAERLQAFREVYFVAPAELETGTYSNRFAAHILKYRQAYALIKTRGWSVRALGPYDNDGGRQWRDFESCGIRAEFWMEHAAEDWDEQDMLANLAATDQVRFTTIGGGEPIPLAEVPAPESFGELGASAETRRDVLRQLVPQLKIADCLELADRYLRVRGDLRTYKIHLGSANVLMEPNDEYLCIVPAGGKTMPNVFLPFEDDFRLSVIISKALLLAADRSITDETILRQIRR